MASLDASKDSSKLVSIPQYPLAAELKAGATEPPSLTKIVGFLGNSAEPRNCRVYTSDLLTEYVEFLRTEIVHSEAPGPSPLGPTSFWVRSDLPLRYTTVTSLTTQAAFLGGSIASGSANTGSTFQSMTAHQPRIKETAVNICAKTDHRTSCPDVCPVHQPTSGGSCGSTSADSCGAPFPSSSGCSSTASGCSSPDTFACAPTTKGMCD
jgi:hypothetical protein